MEVYVGRQPIFNRKKEVIAYELLYRNSYDNQFLETDGDKATADLILNSFLTIGIENLTDWKKTFINFTENLLLKEIPTYFPPNLVVIEIIENVNLNNELLEVCKKFKDQGYMIALDDVEFSQDYTEFLPYIDILKVDFLKNSVVERREIIKKYKNTNIKFLAEKVETLEEFEAAYKDGYDYFQGYFFAKPTILTGNAINNLPDKYLIILAEINNEEPNVSKITRLIEQDVSLTYRLLKLVNSAAFQFKTRISSVNHAILILGLNELGKWITVMTLSSVAINCQAKEIIKVSLSRAYLAEQISLANNENASEYFLLGMLSLMDGLLHRKMEDILNEIPITDKLRDALLGIKNEYTYVLELFKMLETGNIAKDKIIELVKLARITEKELYHLYFESMEWSSQIVNEIDIS